MSTFTYPETGATRHGPLPRGYHHLHHRAPVGGGAGGGAGAGAAARPGGCTEHAGARPAGGAP
ncbi:DUF1990 family protein, partial [Streptomyces californicus]|uniref:DUF1990 family protein n=1 Tax=Streptomyces californicus TaxID=67351 RepID=UPI00365F60E6